MDVLSGRDDAEVQLTPAVDAQTAKVAEHRTGFVLPVRPESGDLGGEPRIVGGSVCGSHATIIRRT